MKKNFLILSLAVFSFACNSSSNSSEKKEEVKPTVSANPDIDKGLALASASDCFTCHKIKEQYVGPQYNAIGQKYPNTDANIAMLADKIVKGGSGNWGAVPMTPHPNISKEDAVLMVKYILSLKDEK